ncbi:MAG: DNA cytosine methyltransferase [Bacteroidaceae bacterium]|nr:DNA cytosine methyltransferase [Bacteroidaceae bacterium]
MAGKYKKQQPQQLDLFQLQMEYPKEIIQNSSQEIDLDNLDVSKNVLICNVKKDNTRHFLDGTAKIYYTGKEFPSTIALNKLYYFIPYFGTKCGLGFTGFRDLYLIKIARVGTRKEGEPDNDPKDLRLVFELQFVKRLFEQYHPHRLNIWNSFTDTTLAALSEAGKKQTVALEDTIVFNEGDVRIQKGKLTHIDCFAGPGGICTGLHAAGMQTLVAIEYIKSCCETYTANHPEVHVIHSDIREVMAEQIVPYIPANGVDLVTSGMPCETFSTAGNTSRSFYDDRQFLFREGIRIAQIANAKMILFENVPAITSKREAKQSGDLIVNILKRELRAAGYGNYIEVVLDSTKYGVPQKRNRFFILACRFPEWKLGIPKPLDSPIVTVKEALAGLPNVIANSNQEGKEYTDEHSDFEQLMRNDAFWDREMMSSKSIMNHMPMKHRECTLKRFALLRQGESLKSLFDRYQGDERERLQDERILPKKMFIKRNYRLLPDEPSPTVTSHCLDEFVHPDYDRALTVRECARLQSFPDSYTFAGGPYIVPHIDRTVQDKYEQIGDAVPPLLAYAWGKKIIELFETND